MSCAKALVEDISKLFLDPQFSDVVLLCQGEETRAHRVILSTRSPVFRAMLQSEMSECVTGKIQIDDANKDVLKEMMRYMYCAKVDEKFTQFKVLLILADKYQVDELIKYCGTKMVESLNKDNVLQIGIFAELHNAEDLMKECVKFIIDNKPGSLNKNWKDHVKGSSKMMLEMVQHLLVDNYGKIYEISRVGSDIDRYWNEGYTSAIAFQVDSKIKLCGIGMFGSNIDQLHVSVEIRVLDEQKSLLVETKTLISNGSPIPVQLLFTNPVPVEANQKYHITAKQNAAHIYFGKRFKETVVCAVGDKDAVKVSFHKSRHDMTSTNDAKMGQFPILYFRY